MLRSRQLYDWLFRPLEGFIAERQITTIVVVPDGALRLVAMGALHDGTRFAIEKLAITTVTGLSMTNTSSPSTQQTGLLVAGISDPGPVVEKLSQANIEQLLDTAIPKRDDAGGPAHERALASPRSADSTSVLKRDSGDRIKALREALALPGVRGEVEAISRISRSTSMLNEPFTVDGFRRAAESGAYRVVHVASHGVFGGTADSSYILAYDDLLTLDGLESLLKSDKFRRNPIELLSLSACQTAEGDDRSPLGIAGAAIKARARSVVATLWAVEDNSARIAMEKFYRGLLVERMSKAQALRQSQIVLLRSDEYRHPFFRAPFVLIGNWL
jgi:CHAT domain-containing protein